MVEGIELTNLLDPYMFANHRDIVNALFEVYFSIGEQYLDKFYDPAKGNLIKDLAKDRIDKKYQLNNYSAANMKTIRENEAL